MEADGARAEVRGFACCGLGGAGGFGGVGGFGESGGSGRFGGSLFSEVKTAGLATQKGAEAGAEDKEKNQEYNLHAFILPHRKCFML